MTVREESLQDVLKYGMYTRTTEDDIECVCNICGKTFEFPMDVLEHIINKHMNDELPDVDPSAPVDPDPFFRRLKVTYLCGECNRTQPMTGREAIKGSFDGKPHWVMCECGNHQVNIVIAEDRDGKYDEEFRNKVKDMFSEGSFDLRFEGDDGAWDVM